MPFGPHPCDDPNHGKTVVPVYLLDMVELTIETYNDDTCSSVHEDVTEATMLRCHDIGFTCVVTAVPWDAVGCGRKLFRPCNSARIPQ
jgi:hypothetical protein